MKVSTSNSPTYYPYPQDHQRDILDILLQKNSRISRSIYTNVYIELDSDHLPTISTFAVLPVLNMSTPRLINGYIEWEKFKTKLD